MPDSLGKETLLDFPKKILVEYFFVEETNISLCLQDLGRDVLVSCGYISYIGISCAKQSDCGQTDQHL